ncbi:hypothetical protein [Actinophytocola sp.]|uniref:hypothetical protein n=1 Tax=Actinophytocola sp. TaxID=1872138 RepID=UPI00389A3DDE
MVSDDAISVKFEHLRDLKQAILNAQNSLQQNRTDWMTFTTGTMNMAWADDAGEGNQFRNANFDTYGQKNEEFLANLMRAVDQAEQDLRGAVQRARTSIMG